MSEVNTGVYVHRISKGYKRLFFNVSVPLEVINVDDAKLAKEPEAVGKEIATILDLALLPRGGRADERT